MGHNSPYAISDVRVHRLAVESTQQEIYIGSGFTQPICRPCFYGVHPHGETEHSDCKVLLKDPNTGFRTGNQCCCTWREGGKA